MMPRLNGFDLRRGAAACWLAAALLYLVAEAVTASAFRPTYSYVENYISDLGVSGCGTIFDGRGICSPLHGVMNADFFAQAVLFFAAAAMITGTLATRVRYLFLGAAAVNGVGNVLLGVFAEDAGTSAGATAHIIGAILAIVFGNVAAFISVWAFAELRLPILHRRVSLVLPLLAAVALTALAYARQSGTALALPDGVWERTSVYAITGWELVSALVCFRRAPIEPLD